MLVNIIIEFYSPILCNLISGFQTISSNSALTSDLFFVRDDNFTKNSEYFFSCSSKSLAHEVSQTLNCRHCCLYNTFNYNQSRDYNTIFQLFPFIRLEPRATSVCVLLFWVGVTLISSDSESAGALFVPRSTDDIILKPQMLNRRHCCLIKTIMLYTVNQLSS